MRSPHTPGRNGAHLEGYLGRRIVLDTEGPMVFIGQLEAYDDRGYWLVDADVHDRNEGHASNEEYVNDAALLARDGTRQVNRRRVFVERTAIVCISALEDVVVEGHLDEEELRD